MSTLFINLDPKDSGGCSLFSVDRDTSVVRLGGSTDVDLVDGVKSPDFSLYEDHPAKRALTQAWPTVVWEVAYSEDEKKLAHDLGRHVACSLGRVRLAIGVNIERSPAVAGQPVRDLKKVTCVFWEADYIEQFATLEESGSQLNHLTRCDSSTRDTEDYVLPAATKYSCVSKFGEKYIKFFVSQHALYQVSSFLQNASPFTNVSGV
jgi:hypothetical protein